jgi:hypothetical protein
MTVVTTAQSEVRRICGLTPEMLMHKRKSAIGADVVEMLEADQSPKHYDIDQLKAIKAKYRALANQLEKQR